MILVRLFFQVDANSLSLSHQMTRTWLIHRLPPGPAPHHHNLPSCPPQPRVTNWPLLLTCGLRRHLLVTHRQPWVKCSLNTSAAGPRPHPWPGHRRCRWPGPGLSSSLLFVYCRLDPEPRHCNLARQYKYWALQLTTECECMFIPAFRIIPEPRSRKSVGDSEWIQFNSFQ